MKKLFRKIRKIYYKYKALRTLDKGEVPKDIHINGKTIFTNKTHIGHDCHFNGLNIGGKGEVYIGSHFHSGTGILMITSNHNYDLGTELPYDNEEIKKTIRIGENVWLGSRVIVLPGTIIEDGVIVQAGSVCVGKLPYCSICGGHPAKPIKYRNIEHYENLLKNNTKDQYEK